MTNDRSPRSRSADRCTAEAVRRRLDAELRRPAGGPGPRRGLPGLGRRRARVPRPDRRDRGERRSGTPTRPSSRRSAARWPPWRTSPTSSCTSARSRSPSACCSRLARPRRRAGSSWPTPAPRPTRPRSSWRGAPGPGRPYRGRRGRLPRPHHGRARAHRQGADPHPVRAVRPDVRFVALRRRRGAAGRDRPRRRRRLPRARPGRERRRARPRGLPGGRPRSLRPGRRPARARRDPDRHRPHRRVVRAPGRPASGPTSSPWPRGSAAGCRSAPASASARPAPASPRATTAPPSAATRSPAPPPSRCST